MTPEAIALAERIKDAIRGCRSIPEVKLRWSEWWAKVQDLKADPETMVLAIQCKNLADVWIQRLSDGWMPEQMGGAG